MERCRRLLSLVTLCGAACQGDTLPVGGDEPLDSAAVEGLPTGNGVGSGASGSYNLTRSNQRSCRCSGADEAGLCEIALAGTGLMLVQDDGALRMQLLDVYTVLADIVLAETGASQDLVEYKGEENFTTRIKIVDYSKARKDLNHEATIDIREGVKRYVAWLKETYKDTITV